MLIVFSVQNWQAALPVIDPLSQTLELELWDANVLSTRPGHDCVSVTRFRLGALLGDADDIASAPGGAAGAKVGHFAGWLPLSPHAQPSLASPTGLITNAGDAVRAGRCEARRRHMTSAGRFCGASLTRATQVGLGVGAATTTIGVTASASSPPSPKLTHASVHKLRQIWRSAR